MISTLQSLCWFTGVVENRDDPIKSGRVQIRMHGVDTPDKAVLPISDLIWAQVATGISSASKDGVGTTPSDLLVGSWVFGVFLDGKNAQMPLVLSTFLGLTDSNPDVNKLARNEGVVDHERLSNIPVESGSALKEHPSTYATTYPYNRVRETESGHIEEFDDTPGKERIRRKHRTGTYAEVHPNGDQTERVVGEKDVHIEKHLLVHALDNATITVRKGAKILINSETGENLRLRVGNNGNIFIKVDNGNVNLEVNGNITEKITGSIDRTVGGSITEKVGGNFTRTVGGKQDLLATGITTIKGELINLN